MKYGKRVCQSLKVVRKQIADANEIPYEITECPHQGNCPGTCPKCESELRYIENQLSLRRAAGKAISLVGLSLGISSAFANTIEPQNNITANQVDSLTVDTAKVQEDEENLANGFLSTDIIQPEFPGGEAALMEFIKKNLLYPESIPGDAGIQGRVTLSFNVEKDGSIDNIKVLRSPAKELSEEAIRVVKSMPKWKPGKYNGKIARTIYVLPITFRIE